MRDRRRSVRWAWARLCGAALRGDEGDTRKLAATSLRNLAGIRAYNAKERWPATPKPGPKERERRPLRLRIGYLAASCELRQGRPLDRADAEMHFELGKVYAARRKWRAAARQLERAVEIVPDRPRFWIQLARAYAGPDPTEVSESLRKRAAFASGRAIAQPSDIVQGGFERLKEVSPASETASRRTASPVSSDSSMSARHGGPTNRPAPSSRHGSTGWARRTCGRPPRCLCNSAGGISDAPTRNTSSASPIGSSRELDSLCKKHPREVRRHGIYALTAEVLHAAERKTEALRYAEAAVVHDPLSESARKVLAQLYLDLGHLEQAKEAVTQFQLCVTLRFQPLLSHLRLGVAHLRLGHVCSGERILRGVCGGVLGRRRRVGQRGTSW